MLTCWNFQPYSWNLGILSFRGWLVWKKINFLLGKRKGGEAVLQRTLGIACFAGIRSICGASIPEVSLCTDRILFLPRLSNGFIFLFLKNLLFFPIVELTQKLISKRIGSSCCRFGRTGNIVLFNGVYPNPKSRGSHGPFASCAAAFIKYRASPQK